jgi:uncharacterized protein (UPF0248 family)
MADSDSTSSKGARLRPANEIFSQLKWDGRFDDSEFLVAYYDRVANQLMSKELSQWTSDTTEEEFIPLHRIEFFYRKSDRRVVWHRKTRVDLLSGRDTGNEPILLALDGHVVSVDISFSGFQNKSVEYIMNRLYFEDDDTDLWGHVTVLADDTKK